MLCSRSAALPLTALLCLQTGVLLAQDTDAKAEPESKRPTLSIKASPGSGMAPVRIFLTGELKGGSDDYEEYYCPAVEWTWGDGTVSQSSADCDPYEAGKSTIRRRHTAEHIYRRPGQFRVQLSLKKKEKAVATAATIVRILGGYGGIEP